MAAPKDTNILKQAILQFLKSNPRHEYNYKQIAKALNLTLELKIQIPNVLNTLEQDQSVIQTAPGKFRLAHNTTQVEGQIDFNSKGMAFVHIDGFQEDVMIAAEDTGTALQGDTVAVELLNRKSTKRHYGRVLHVVQRARLEFVGSQGKKNPDCFYAIQHN